MTSPDIETIPKPEKWRDTWRFMPGANRQQKRLNAKAMRKIAVEQRRNHPPDEPEDGYPVLALGA